jgi:hypothetical protein
LGDLLVFAIGQTAVQPIVADGRAEGCLRRDEKFVAGPIRKSADGEKLNLCAVKVSRML